MLDETSPDLGGVDDDAYGSDYYDDYSDSFCDENPHDPDCEYASGRGLVVASAVHCPEGAGWEPVLSREEAYIPRRMLGNETGNATATLVCEPCRPGFYSTDGSRCTRCAPGSICPSASSGDKAIKVRRSP